MLKKRVIPTVLSIIMILSMMGCGLFKKKAPEHVPTPIPTGEPVNQTDNKNPPDATAKEEPYTKLIWVDNIKKEVSVPYTPVNFEKKVKPYSVSKDLSNIANLKQFGSFSEGQKELLAKNGFVISPTDEEQLFYIYEKNQYLKIPNLITTDSVLQVYHVFYDYSLRHLESDSLIKVVEEFTESMLAKSLHIYSLVNNPDVKAAALKNSAYFAAAQLALKKNLPPDIPKDIKALAEKEYALIQGEEGFKKSAIFPFSMDYSQFKPRGHYTSSDDYKRYFKAVMWYGKAPFPLYKNAQETERNIEQTLQALLITYSVFLNKEGTSDAELWEKIYEPTVFYVGKSDDLTIYDYKDLFKSVYGINPDIEKLNDPERLDKFYAEASKLPSPKITGKYTSVDTPSGKQFRLIGQRYVPDSEIIQGMIDPKERPKGSGLDVMGALGSDRALEIELQSKDNSWEGFTKAFKKVRDQLSRVPESTWRSNMYYGWLWTLNSLMKPCGEEYPSFMTNTAWQDKSLNTALGSWSELRHNTILYSKDIVAECGGWEIPKVLGYVEPSVETYNRLLWLTRYSRENLDNRGILNENIRNGAESFERLLQFLIDCSVKELKNEELSDDEYSQILTYGGLLENLTANLISDGGKWHQLSSDIDKNMAVIADFETIIPNGYMEAGIGPANEIYAVVPIGGKLYLTRGAVFSYYEFLSTGKRLTDEEWRAMLKEKPGPELPYWMKNLLREGKGEIPVPAEPFNSGC